MRKASEAEKVMCAKTSIKQLGGWETVNHIV